MTREVRWLLAQGVDPERVAVFYPDGGGYAFAVTAALEDSGIPFYTDQQLSAASHWAGAVLAGGPARHGGRLAQPRHALPDQKRLCAPDV